MIRFRRQDLRRERELYARYAAAYRANAAHRILLAFYTELMNLMLWRGCMSFADALEVESALEQRLAWADAK